jgi:hypothetical protein
MNPATKLRARVSPEAISKVTCIFNGTLDDILNELLQNARRAGASQVAITTEHLDDACLISITDNGTGITDPADLVSLGQSDWPADCCAREDPAGMGFFSLAGLDTVVSSSSASSSFTLAIAGAAWTGEADIDVLPWEGPQGTTIAFSFEPQRDGKFERAVQAAARYYPLPVTLNGAPITRADFLEGAHAVSYREGYRIGVYNQGYSPHRETINFHGLVLGHTLPQIKEVHGTLWSVKVDIVDAPDLVLVLPARKEIFLNEALEQLTDLCRAVIFEAIRAEPFHRLTFDDWELAKTFDNAFPEAAVELPPWRMVHANDSYRERPEFVPIDAAATIYDDTDSFDSVSFGRAIAYSHDEGCDADANQLLVPKAMTFFAPITNFAGYSWYDALPSFVRTGETYRQLDGTETPCEADEVTFRPDVITLELTDQHGNHLFVESDFAIRDGDDCWSDADAAQVALTRASKIDPGDLTELIIDAVFSPSEDTDADSYDTQEMRFRHDAVARAYAILEGEDSAIVAGIRLAFADRIAWRIPRGRTLALSWSDAGRKLELLSASEESGQ